MASFPRDPVRSGRILGCSRAEETRNFGCSDKQNNLARVCPRATSICSLGGSERGYSPHPSPCADFPARNLQQLPQTLAVANPPFTRAQIKSIDLKAGEQNPTILSLARMMAVGSRSPRVIYKSSAVVGWVTGGWRKGPSCLSVSVSSRRAGFGEATLDRISLSCILI